MFGTRSFTYALARSFCIESSGISAYLKTVEMCKRTFEKLQQDKYVRYENLPLRHKSGERIEVEFVSNVYDVNGKKVIQCNVRDITERKQAAKALRESEERFQLRFDQAAVGIAHVSLDGQLLLVNHKFCDIVGYSSEELLAAKFEEIIYPGDLEADLAHVHRLLAGETQSYLMEKRYVWKDGSPVWVKLTDSLVRCVVSLISWAGTTLQAAATSYCVTTAICHDELLLVQLEKNSY